MFSQPAGVVEWGAMRGEGVRKRWREESKFCTAPLTSAAHSSCSETSSWDTSVHDASLPWALW